MERDCFVSDIQTDEGLTWFLAQNCCVKNCSVIVQQ